MRHGCPHCKAIGAVTVAYCGDEGCLKCPDTVTKALLLMFVKGRHGFILGEKLIFGGIRAIEKALINAAHDLGKPSSVRSHAHDIAVSFLFSEGDLAGRHRQRGRWN